MTLDELKKEIVRRGSDSLQMWEREPHKAHKIAGGKKALKLFLTLNTPEDFEREIKKARGEEIEILKTREPQTFENAGKYKKARYFTLNLEYCFEIMKVAWNHANPRLYHFPSVSARAVGKYAEIVGVSQPDEKVSQR